MDCLRLRLSTVVQRRVLAHRFPTLALSLRFHPAGRTSGFGWRTAFLALWSVCVKAVGFLPLGCIVSFRRAASFAGAGQPRWLSLDEP